MDFDFIIIGAGITGLALSGTLSKHGRVALLEQEEYPCYHSSGRSAAIFVNSYGSEIVQGLTSLASGLFQKAKEDGDFDALAIPRGILVVTPKGSNETGEAPFRTRISAQEAAKRMPALDADRLEFAYWEDGARDIDVHAMQTGYMRHLRESGGKYINNSPVKKAEYIAGNWHLVAGNNKISAPIVINAAGAWAEKIGEIFGAIPQSIKPLKRSAALIEPPTGLIINNLPFVVDAAETVYFKPDAGKFMLSPADETPVEPHDCWADDIDIAIAVERYEQLTGNEVKRVTHTWAGLRSFVPDENPILGEDTKAKGYYWMAALGGFGVQTAPATAALVEALILKDTGNLPLDQNIINACKPNRFSFG